MRRILLGTMIVLLIAGPVFGEPMGLPVAAPVSIQETIPPDPDIAPEEGRDIAPAIDEVNTRLQMFLASAAVLMGVLAYGATQALKFALPKTKIGTRAIYGGVVAVFSVLFVIANWAGWADQLQRGIEVGTILAEPVKVLLGMFLVPSALYAVGQRANNPVMGGRQGANWFALSPPRRANSQEFLRDADERWKPPASQLAQG